MILCQCQYPPEYLTEHVRFNVIPASGALWHILERLNKCDPMWTVLLKGGWSVKSQLKIRFTSAWYNNWISTYYIWYNMLLPVAVMPNSVLLVLIWREVECIDGPANELCLLKSHIKYIAHWPLHHAIISESIIPCAVQYQHRLIEHVSCIISHSTFVSKKV